MRLQPSDCIIAVGIPLKREDFMSCVDRVHEQNLIRTQALSWSKYEREVVAPFCRAAHTWRKLGVHVYTSVSIAKLKEIFHANNPKVVMLISHAHGSFIELIEGMVPTSEVLNVIPESYSGTIDLCVCNSRTFAKQLKQERPNLIVKYSDNPAMYTVWFGVYSIMFALVQQGAFTFYADALDQALDAFRTT